MNKRCYFEDKSEDDYRRRANGNIDNLILCESACKLEKLIGNLDGRLNRNGVSTVVARAVLVLIVVDTEVKLYILAASRADMPVCRIVITPLL